MPSLKRHVPNPFKALSKHFVKQGPSAASLAKFLPAAPIAVAPPAPAPKAAKRGMMGEARKLLTRLCKPSSNPRVAKAQQSVISAVVQPQEQTNWFEYEAALQTLAKSAAPATPTAADKLLDASDETNYLAALQLSDPAVYGSDLAQAFTPQCLVPSTQPVAPSPQELLAQREAQLKQAMTQLMADMDSKGQLSRTALLDDGSRIYANFQLDQSGQKTGTFVIEDDVGYQESGQYGDWFSLKGGSLWLNKGPVADHSRPGYALLDGKDFAERLLKAG